MDNLRQTNIREALRDLGQRPLYYAEKGTSLRQVLTMLSNFRILSLPIVETNSPLPRPTTSQCRCLCSGLRNVCGSVHRRCGGGLLRRCAGTD